MTSRLQLTLVSVLSAVVIGVLWGTELPLGIPGEWTWERVPSPGNSIEMALGFVEVLIVGGIYLEIASAGLSRFRDDERSPISRVRLLGWLAALTAGGLCWLVTVQAVVPSSRGLEKIPFVIYSRGASGYFHKARYEVANLGDFLSGYESLMAEGDTLHLGTHPPGLFVGYRALIATVDSVPSLQSVAELTMPNSVSEAFDVLNDSATRPDERLSRSDRAVIWLAALLTMSACAATVIPLFFLIALTCDRRSAWGAIAFWPLLPALAVFTPKSDVLFAFPAALLLCVWMLAVHRRSVGLGVVAGLVGWLCLFCSLAFLPIGLVAFIAGLLFAPDRDTKSPDKSLAARLWLPVVGGVVSILMLTLATAVIFDMNLLKVWQHNYHNHAAFYDNFTRTNWKWLIESPIELLVACGVPVFALALSRLKSDWSNIQKQPASGNFVSRRRSLPSETVAVSLVWGLLWLSCKNSGEVARLWCPLLPLLIWLSASPGLSNRHRQWLGLLVVQMVTCWLTVARVSGFHF